MRSLGIRRREQTESLFVDVAPFTLCDPERLQNLRRLCREVNAANIPGDFVECGTYKGGSAAVLSVVLGPRHLWLYDSFCGLPQASAADGEEAKAWAGQLAATPSDVREAMSVVGTPQAKYTIREGLFTKTFEQPGPCQVALLHCDADWYESVMQVLEKFYPIMPRGGCVILDDFGYWEGCREAFYDFCKRQNEKPLLERLAPYQAYWFKGRDHNRPQNGRPLDLLGSYLSRMATARPRSG